MISLSTTLSVCAALCMVGKALPHSDLFYQSTPLPLVAIRSHISILSYVPRAWEIIIWHHQPRIAWIDTQSLFKRLLHKLLLVFSETNRYKICQVRVLIISLSTMVLPIDCDSGKEIPTAHIRTFITPSKNDNQLRYSARRFYKPTYIGSIDTS